MKEGIHPNYVESQVECACGNKFTTRSTIPKVRLEICAMCHPFYTGKQKLVDTAGRLEKFQKRFAKTEGKTVVRKSAAKKAVPAKQSKKVGKILRNTPRVAAPEKRGARAPGDKKEAKAPKTSPR